MGATHTTHSRKTTGASGARRREAAKTGRHAALPASQRKGEEASGVLESAVGAPASPTAIEKAAPQNYPCPDLLPPHPGLCLCPSAAGRANGLASPGGGAVGE
eukprot:6213095-Pleurochrysis_carterae.AAC.1